MAWAKTALQLSIWLALITAVLLPLERRFGRLQEGQKSRVSWQDVAYYYVNSCLPALMLALPLSVAATLAQKLWPAGWLQTVGELPLIWRLLLGLLVGELGFYWGHRLSHQWPVLWRFHRLHHEPTRMGFLVNVHAHPLDLVFTRMMGLVPMTMLGLAGPTPEGVGIPLAVVLFGRVWSFVLHANLPWRWGILSYLIATPHFHHWHHSREAPLNRNFASHLPLMDLLFGSFHLPKGWPSSYGVESAPDESLGVWRRLRTFLT